MKKIISVLIICFSISNVQANKQNIIATVNNIPITNYDLEARRKIIIMINNVRSLNKEQNEELSKVALESLIDEQLILQIGKKMKKKVTESQIDAACENIEQSNKLPKGSLKQVITTSGASVESFREKMKADILKMSILSQLNESVNISAKEIETTILDGAHKDTNVEAIIFTSKTKNPEEYTNLINLRNKLNNYWNILGNSKNYLNIKNANTTSNNLDNIAQEINQVIFKEVDRNNNCDSVYYDSWLNERKINSKLSQLDSISQAIIKDLNVNQISNVFESSQGFNIIMLLNKVMDKVTEEENQIVVDFLTNKKTNKKALKIFSDLRRNAVIKRY